MRKNIIKLLTATLICTLAVAMTDGVLRRGVFAEGEDGVITQGEGVVQEDETTEAEYQYDSDEDNALDDLLNSEQYNGLLDENDEGLITSDSSGSIDIFTGSKTIDENGNVSTNVVTLDNNTLFDKEKNMFLYPVQDGNLYISVIDGMIVTDSVTIVKDGEFNMAIYKDGKEMDEVPDTLSNPGSYSIIVWDNNSENRLMAFQILGSVSGQVDSYPLPKGFNVKSVYINGTEVRSDQGTVDMKEEGYYEITYTCFAADKDFVLRVTMDHTPPQIEIEGLDKNNKARGPVTIKGLQEDESLYIKRDGNVTKLNYKGQLTESGSYELTASDEAGNTVHEDFDILLYLNVKAVVLLGIFILIIIGVIVALYIERKRLRVR